MVAEPIVDSEVVVESEPEALPDTDVVAEDANDVEVEVEAPEPNAEGEDPESVGDEQPSLDLSSLTIADLRTANPELAQQLEYAGEQRKEAQLRKEAGSREATAARVQWFKDNIAKLDDSAEGDINFLDQNNYANAAGRHLSELTQAWDAAFEPTTEERARITEAATAGDVNTLALVTLDTAVRHLGHRQVHDMDISEIPADSNLAQSHRAALERAQTQEDRASEKETVATGKRPNSPVGPSSSAATYSDPAWVRDQMNNTPGWLQELSPDGKTTNLARSQPAIKAAQAIGQKDD